VFGSCLAHEPEAEPLMSSTALPSLVTQPVVDPRPGLDCSTLVPFGWDARYAAAFALAATDSALPGRVVGGSREQLKVAVPGGEGVALVPGRLLHHAESPADLPCVGDWLALRPIAAGEPWFVESVLPRRSLFLRRAAGKRTSVQALAANVDTAFLVTALDGDFNPRRLERWLALTRQAGAAPVVVLNKADVAGEQAVRERAAEAAAAAPGVPVVVTVASAGSGLEALAPWLLPGATVALLGSSGVGKSTLANALAGEVRLATSELGSDGRGRHTTSRRELVAMPGGALLLDTPGLREVGLWLADEPLVDLFPEIAEVAVRCRFRDCTHGAEPGCAVQAAVAVGALPADRLAGLQRLQAEQASLLQRTDAQAAANTKRRWKAIHRAQKKHRPREM
jgi:ribosome biogenesis GTPase